MVKLLQKVFITRNVVRKKCYTLMLNYFEKKNILFLFGIIVKLVENNKEDK
jgi:hypothetical protein